MAHGAPSLPHTIDALFDSVGSRALQAIFILSILMTVVVGVLVATGAGEAYVSEFRAGVSRVIDVSWMYSGMVGLAGSISRASSALRSVNLLGLLVEVASMMGALAMVVANVIDIVLTGYVDLAVFVIDTVPPIVKPVGMFLGIGLVFVQFCVVWVVAKYVLNLVSYFASVATGRASL